MSETLADLVSSQAEKRPDSVAVRCGTEEMTWRQLDEASARLAAGLLAFGVGPGDRVGVWLFKSLRTVVAVHGVLRAGAAYVPLDPAAPAASLGQVLTDAGVEVLVTDQPAAGHIDPVVSSAPGLRAAVGAECAELETVAWADLPEPGRRPTPQGDDLAYVMYTSGSTGAPKGIMHTHGSGMAYATRAAKTYGLGPQDRLAFLTPIHFDMSTFELFAGPRAGATTVVVTEPYLRLPASLAGVLEEQAVTTLYGVPFLFTQLLDRGVLEERDLSSVRWLLYGGEPFAPGALRRWMTQFPGCRVANVYGPAEVNQCTHHEVLEPPADDDPVPIGSCWDGAVGRVADRHGAPVAVGEVGELHVRAPTLMRGYWNRPDLTASAIDVDEHDRRWYRTGDLVYETMPGTYVFVARVDDQVKVRGHRLELTTVELAMASVDDVSHAVVGVVRGADDATELAAVFVGAASPDAVRQAIAQQLPPYAVPTRLVAVDGLPLGRTGKIDRHTTRTELIPSLLAPEGVPT